MSEPVIQVGAVGVTFIFTARDQDGAIVDVSTATGLTGYFRAGPKGTLKSFGCILTTDGTDGKFEYPTAAVADLDVAHDCWQRQGGFTIPGGYDGRTEVKTFAVKPNLT